MFVVLEVGKRLDYKVFGFHVAVDEPVVVELLGNEHHLFEEVLAGALTHATRVVVPLEFVQVVGADLLHDHLQVTVKQLQTVCYAHYLLV